MNSKRPSSDTEMSEFVILCVGRTDRSEFRHVLPSLRPWGTVIATPDVPAALATLADDSLTPDVLVIAQSYPGEFVDEQIDKLRRVAPLARLVAVLGTWCEGEMRSGAPWSGAVRVYWHQWRPHCHLELERLRSGRESLWSLPSTACEEERCLAVSTRKHNLNAGLVDIVTEQYDVFEFLAAACLDRGYKPRWRRTHEEVRADAPAVVLFDAAGETVDELARFRQLRVDKGTVVIVLTDFPRIADCDRFVCVGARAVLSRPFFWDDLFWYFEPSYPQVNMGEANLTVRARS